MTTSGPRPKPSSNPPVVANFDSAHLTIGAGVAIFHLATSRVVVCYHSKDRYWFLPKGRRDAGEDSSTGAEREGFEEYMLFWYIAETLPPDIEHLLSQMSKNESGAYQVPPPFPKNMTLAERMKLDKESDPVRHENTGVDDDEALYESYLLPIEEAQEKLRGTIMADVVRTGWEAIRARIEMESTQEDRSYYLVLLLRSSLRNKTITVRKGVTPEGRVPKLGKVSKFSRNLEVKISHNPIKIGAMLVFLQGAQAILVAVTAVTGLFTYTKYVDDAPAKALQAYARLGFQLALNSPGVRPRNVVIMTRSLDLPVQELDQNSSKPSPLYPPTKTDRAYLHLPTLQREVNATHTTVSVKSPELTQVIEAPAPQVNEERATALVALNTQGLERYSQIGKFKRPVLPHFESTIVPELCLGLGGIVVVILLYIFWRLRQIRQEAISKAEEQIAQFWISCVATTFMRKWRV
ncbi:MAG: hypothetical protein Q9166_004541 [cf. Caloplaca sp. 2 TL-2023]